MPSFIPILCKQSAIFRLIFAAHLFISSAVQHINFMVPKAPGLLYINENVHIKPYIHGGGQERNMRAGTENVYGIVGFAKALQIATDKLEEESAHIQGIKYYMIEQLKKQIKGISFNGDPMGRSNYTVLNVSFPKSEKSEMLLMNLDMEGICASGGSACTSGAQQGSHVIRAINSNPNQIPVRFSFSKYNTKEEVDMVVEKLKTSDLISAKFKRFSKKHNRRKAEMEADRKKVLTFPFPNFKL